MTKRKSTEIETTLDNFPAPSIQSIPSNFSFRKRIRQENTNSRYSEEVFSLCSRNCDQDLKYCSKPAEDINDKKKNFVDESISLSHASETEMNLSQYKSIKYVENREIIKAKLRSKEVKPIKSKRRKKVSNGKQYRLKLIGSIQGDSERSTGYCSTALESMTISGSTNSSCSSGVEADIESFGRRSSLSDFEFDECSVIENMNKKESTEQLQQVSKLMDFIVSELNHPG